MKKDSDKEYEFNIKSRSIIKSRVAQAIFISCFIFLVIAAYVSLALILHLTDIYKISNNVNIGWITLDSLLTGATITLIAFSNMSPDSSPSAHIYKSIY